MKYVKCVQIGDDRWWITHPLTIGKRYRVIDKDSNGIRVICDNGISANYMSYRFIPCKNELNINTKVL